MKTKLVLKTETLRTLADDTLALVHGGIVSSDNCASAGRPCRPWDSCRGGCDTWNHGPEDARARPRGLRRN